MPWLFWPALVLLVANDHVLKGSGLLPSVVTGKLSDFAGLVVAPLVLCALFGARSERARALCIAAVVLPFAALKLSPALAAAASELLSAVAPSRIWCDPTDLIALAVLPWTLHLARQVRPLSDSTWPRRLAIGAAALACTATSSDYGESYEVYPPFLINWTHAPITVSITKRSTRCPGATSAEAFEPVEDEITIEPAHMAALGWAFVGADDAAVGCGEAEIRVRGTTLRVAWPLGLQTAPEDRVRGGGENIYGGFDTYRVEQDDQWAFDVGVAIVGAASAPQLLVGEQLEEVTP